MTVKAVYQNGVFKPIHPVNLPEGERVELTVVQSPRRDLGTATLRGIWKHALRPEDQGDWVSETVARMRQESSEKLDRLAGELGENPNRGR